MTKPHQQQVVAHGGRGGRGNWHFRSSHNTAPKYAEQGILGEEFDCIVELRVLADVGLVGFPSVGKSTFLDAVSKQGHKLEIIHLQQLHQMLELYKLVMVEALF